MVSKTTSVKMLKSFASVYFIVGAQLAFGNSFESNTAAFEEKSDDQSPSLSIKDTIVLRNVDLLSEKPSTEEQIESRRVYELSTKASLVSIAHLESDLGLDDAEPKVENVETLQATNETVQDLGPVTPVVYSDAPLQELTSSRERFRELFKENGEETGFDAFDHQFVGSLNKSPEEQWKKTRVVDRGVELVPVGKVTSLSLSKTYTVVNGKIVEVDVTDDAPEFMKSSEAEFSENGSVFVVSAENNETDSSLLVEGFPAEANPIENPSASSFVVADESKALGQLKGPSVSSLEESFQGVLAARESDRKLVSQTASFIGLDGQKESAGVFVRGRVAVPKGFDSRQVVVRVAGTSKQAIPDSEGFFEVGPFSNGSSFELLIFDTNARLNRRLVPYFVSRQTPEKQVNLVSSETVDVLKRAFGRFPRGMESGFCGVVDGVQTEGLSMALMNQDGTAFPLSYFSSLGVPQASRTEISSSGQFCAFGLSGGSYRLAVVGQSARQSFDVHLEPSVFENDLRFEVDAHDYVAVKGLSLVDTEAALPFLSSESASMSFTQALQNNWIAGFDKPMWAPVLDYDLVSEESYSAAKVDNLEALQYVPMGEDLIQFKEPVSGSFELLGRGLVQDMKRKKRPVAHRVLSPETARDLRVAVEADSQTNDFLLFGDIDTSLLVANDSSTLNVTVRDVWTGKPKGAVKVLSEKGDRILRFAASSIPTGVGSLVVESENGQVLWTSIVRVIPGMTQVVSNR